MLLAVVFMTAMLVLSLAVAAPRMAKSIQRDREIETMHRGKQYIRAIQLYYRKFGAYPPSIDALVNTNNMRFLRKKYIDPLTGKDDWRPILFGQNKAPLAMGFFGQPLAGGAMPVGGIGPGGSGGIPGMGGNGMPGAGGGSSFGGPAGGGSSGITGGNLFGSSTDSGATATPGSDQTGAAGGVDANGNPTSGTGTAGGSTGTGTGTSTGTSTGTGTGSGVMGGQTGQTFGGGGLVGVEPVSPRPSILNYKKMSHYNQWEFTYSPLIDMMKQMGGNTGMIGQPAGSMGQPSGSSTSGNGTGPNQTGPVMNNNGGTNQQQSPF